MLTRLVITNLAIIENIDVDFKGGFTVLTGGTGAGKSLVIDSLSLLLGQRASSELIRTGEDKALIKGEFIKDSPQLGALFSRLNIPYENGAILIERIIGKSKSAVKLNGVNVALSDLNELAKYLADIHNQFEFQEILNPENYLSIIDGFSYDLTSTYLRDYTSVLQIYRTKKSEYEALKTAKDKLEESRDFYEYQCKELKEADLKEGEEESIASEISLLKNYDQIYSLSQEADSIIHEDFLDRLYELNKVLAKLAGFQNQYQATHDMLDERYYELNDTLNTLKRDLQNIDYDPDRLNVLEQRDNDLSTLKRKYKKSLPELIAYRDQLQSLVGQDSNFEEDLASKKKEMEDAFALAFQKGKELSEVRQKIALSIEKDLEKNLSDLLLKARFKIIFSESSPSMGDSLLKDNGLDTVDFLIETNVGEGLKSLSKTISGGEASRIMLGFKTIFIKANKISTVIFDEIDTGLSGEAAEAVAQKIHEISLSTQVIAITHMPQVASLSDHHILISKEVKDGRTFTHIKELSLEEKITEVAALISDGKVTPKQLEYAREMVLRPRG